jgi:polysaccharide biosynthesis protein PslG
MRRRLGCLAALVAVLSLGVLAAPGPATAKGPPEFFGIVPQEKLSGADLDRMSRGKVGVVRFSLNWAAVEPSDDQFKWDDTDKLIGDLAAAGIRPLPNASGGPPFVSSDPLKLPVGSAKDEQEWQEFLGEAVKRYGPGGEYWTTVYPTEHPGEQAFPVQTWQIWNEQNGSKHVHQPDPQQYARLIKISHDAISGADPAAEVILGGMFGKPRGGGGIKATSFLKRMYKVPGTKGSFDAVSIHPYSPDVDGLKQQVNSIRKVLKKKKDAGTETWVTELGWGSSKKGRLGVGTKQQANLLKQSFKLLLKKRGSWKVSGVLWYTWRDIDKSKAPCDWCSTAGLFGRNGFDPKPAWKKFVRFTGGS